MDNGESSYRRFLSGDDEGLREIIDMYQDSLVLYLNSIVQNIHTAEDLAEETLAVLVIKQPKFSGKSSFISTFGPYFLAESKVFSSV